MRTRSSRRAVAVNLVGGLAAVACTGTVVASGPGDGTEVPEPGTSEPAPEPLPFVAEFDDDDNGWGGPYQRFDGGEYVWELPAGQRDTRAPDALISIEEELEQWTVTTSFTAEGAAVVALECAYEELEGSSRWYSLELAMDGAVINKRPLGNEAAQTLGANPDVILTDRPTDMAATCQLVEGVYHLTLAVDGVAAVTATDDDPFGRAGAPNLTVLADVEADATVRFDRFELTQVADAASASATTDSTPGST